MFKTSEDSCCAQLGLVFSAFVLRLWVGMRMFFAGLEKFRNPDWDPSDPETMTYSTEFASNGMEAVKNLMMEQTVIPDWSVKIFVGTLPWALIIVGVVVIIGIARQFALLAAGLLLVGLSFGMMMLPDDNQTVWIGIQVGLAALALMVTQFDKLSLDGLIGLFLGKKSTGDKDGDK